MLIRYGTILIEKTVISWNVYHLCAPLYFSDGRLIKCSRGLILGTSIAGPYAGLNEGGVVIDRPKGGERR